MTFPVRYMAVAIDPCADEYAGYQAKVLDTLDDTLPLCQCHTLEDAFNIARAMNEAEGYRVD